MQFKIKPLNGKTIPRKKPLKKLRPNESKCVVHWVMYVVNEWRNEWTFLRSFLSERRAKEFVDDLKNYPEKN